MGAKLVALLACACGLGLGVAGASAAADCMLEAAALTRNETDLPRLEVAPPADRPITCITLETVIDFAKRVKAHIAGCPQSTYSEHAATWEGTRVEYSKHFARKRCRRTLIQ
jgi:hypothetical protein